MTKLILWLVTWLRHGTRKTNDKLNTAIAKHSEINGQILQIVAQKIPDMDTHMDYLYAQQANTKRINRLTHKVNRRNKLALWLESKVL